MLSDDLKPKFFLGEHVKVTHILYRVTERGPGKRILRLWKPSPVSASPLSGVVVGVRTRSNGSINVVYGGDEPAAYLPEKYFPVVLVAYHERYNPLACLTEHVKRLT